MKHLIESMDQIEASGETPPETLTESKFLGHSYHHSFEEKEVTDEDTEQPDGEEDDQSAESSPDETEDEELKSIREALTVAYEDYIASKESKIDRTLQLKKDKQVKPIGNNHLIDSGESFEEKEYSFDYELTDGTVKTFQCNTPEEFERAVNKVQKNPRFKRIVAYDYKHEGFTSEGVKPVTSNIVPIALRLAPLLTQEKRKEAFAALDDLRGKLSAEEVMKVWRMAKVFRNAKSKSNPDELDEDNIVPVAPAGTTTTPQPTGQQAQQTGQQQANKPVPGQPTTTAQQAPAPAGLPTAPTVKGQQPPPKAGQAGGAPVAPASGTSGAPGTPPPPAGANNASTTVSNKVTELVNTLANDPAGAKMAAQKLATLK